jgi:hypothetical protein
MEETALLDDPTFVAKNPVEKTKVTDKKTFAEKDPRKGLEIVDKKTIVQENTRFYYLLRSQLDLLNLEVTEEILREKANYCLKYDQYPDFWLLVSPKFLTNELKERISKTKYYCDNVSTITSQEFANLSIGYGEDVDLSASSEYRSEEHAFYACIISTDEQFMSWLKLRFGDFEFIDPHAKSSTQEKASDLSKSGRSDGIFSFIDVPTEVFDEGPFSDMHTAYLALVDKILGPYLFVLESEPDYLHPSLILKKVTSMLKIFYGILRSPSEGTSFSKRISSNLHELLFESIRIPMVYSKPKPKLE